MKTSVADRENQLLTHIHNWVIQELNGRYKDFVSDKFLSHLLFQRVQHITWGIKPSHESHLPHPFDRRQQIAYDVGCHIFESNLEHHCRAGGNGHHVAQSFDACIKAFTISPLP
jgi:hypothetical protein